MERNGMSAALATHVLQPTDDPLILNCTSHLVTMITIAIAKNVVNDHVEMCDGQTPLLSEKSTR